MTRSGLLTAKLQGEWIELDFPSDPPEACLHPEVHTLINALGLEEEPLFIGKTRLDFYLLEVQEEKLLRELKPDFEALKKMEGSGFILTSRCKLTKPLLAEAGFE